MRELQHQGSPMETGDTGLRIALVNMPFTSSLSPSIQLGLLQAILDSRGIAAKSIYFNLQLAADLGWDVYEALANDRVLLLGEWLFSRAAFDEEAAGSSSYLEAFEAELRKHLSGIGKDLSYLRHLRDHVLPAFIDNCARQVECQHFDVVGFSSIFEQNCAALALARRLKQLTPSLVTVFGGANFEDEMGLEYVRSLPWIDYAVVGEGDEVFPAFLQRLASGEDAGALPGVASRSADGTVRFAGRAPQVTNLDALPAPDYSDYFSTAKQLAMPDAVQGKTITVPFETARGCWWGEKHHCTFCGLNGVGMAFRSKSPDRALKEIDTLAQRHDIYKLVAVDNILDLRYIKNVFEELAKRRIDYTFFYETKANLSSEQLKQLAQGGVRHLQPGIESLNTNILKIMRKGTTGINNVRALKWGLYYGIFMHWNILLGFPGESGEDYDQQIATMRLISHLQPPSSIGPIWLERFSPFFSEREKLGMTNVRPEPAYRYVYPEFLDLDRIAYFFSYDAKGVVPASYYDEMTDHVKAWQEQWSRAQPPFLVYQKGTGRLTVTDARQPGPSRILSFGELSASIYEYCVPVARGFSQITEYLNREMALDVDEETVQGSLDEFHSHGLMLKENETHLSLALPVNSNW
jgi:ribosomal peptide maturation radical SAM protein 1